MTTNNLTLLNSPSDQTRGGDTGQVLVHNSSTFPAAAAEEQEQDQREAKQEHDDVEIRPTPLAIQIVEASPVKDEEDEMIFQGLKMSSTPLTKSTPPYLNSFDGGSPHQLLPPSIYAFPTANGGLAGGDMTSATGYLSQRSTTSGTTTNHQGVDIAYLKSRKSSASSWSMEGGPYLILPQPSDQGSSRQSSHARSVSSCGGGRLEPPPGLRAPPIWTGMSGRTKVLSLSHTCGLDIERSVSGLPCHIVVATESKDTWKYTPVNDPPSEIPYSRNLPCISWITHKKIRISKTTTGPTATGSSSSSPGMPAPCATGVVSPVGGASRKSISSAAADKSLIHSAGCNKRLTSASRRLFVVGPRKSIYRRSASTFRVGQPPYDQASTGGGGCVTPDHASSVGAHSDAHYYYAGQVDQGQPNGWGQIFDRRRLLAEGAFQNGQSSTWYICYHEFAVELGCRVHGYSVGVQILSNAHSSVVPFVRDETRNNTMDESIEDINLLGRYLMDETYLTKKLTDGTAISFFGDRLLTLAPMTTTTTKNSRMSGLTSSASYTPTPQERCNFRRSASETYVTSMTPPDLLASASASASATTATKAVKRTRFCRPSSNYQFKWQGRRRSWPEMVDYDNGNYWTVLCELETSILSLPVQGVRRSPGGRCISLDRHRLKFCAYAKWKGDALTTCNAAFWTPRQLALFFACVGCYELSSRIRRQKLDLLSLSSMSGQDLALVLTGGKAQLKFVQTALRLLVLAVDLSDPICPWSRKIAAVSASAKSSFWPLSCSSLGWLPPPEPPCIQSRLSICSKLGSGGHAVVYLARASGFCECGFQCPSFAAIKFFCCHQRQRKFAQILSTHLALAAERNQQQQQPSVSVINKMKTWLGVQTARKVPFGPARSAEPLDNSGSKGSGVSFEPVRPGSLDPLEPLRSGIGAPTAPVSLNRFASQSLDSSSASIQEPPPSRQTTKEQALSFGPTTTAASTSIGGRSLLLSSQPQTISISRPEHTSGGPWRPAPDTAITLDETICFTADPTPPNGDDNSSNGLSSLAAGPNFSRVSEEASEEPLSTSFSAGLEEEDGEERKKRLLSQPFKMNQSCPLQLADPTGRFVSYGASRGRRNRRYDPTCNISRDERARDYEALVMSKLPVHPNLMQFHGILEIESTHALILEHCSGGSLHCRIFNSASGFSQARWRESLQLFRQLAQGLAALHAAGFVHRDIKPSNFLIGSDGTAKIADFGMAVQVVLDPSAYGAYGNVFYAAPEVVRGEGFWPRSDIFSFGVSLWEALTGQGAYANLTKGQVQSRLAVIDSEKEMGNLFPLPQWLSPDVRDLLRRMLGPRRESRPTSLEVAAALDEILESIEGLALAKMEELFAFAAM